MVKKKKKNPYSKALRACAMLCLVAQLSLTVLRSHGLYPIRLLWSWDSPGKTTGMGCPAFLWGIFLTWGHIAQGSRDTVMLSDLSEGQRASRSWNFELCSWYHALLFFPSNLFQFFFFGGSHLEAGEILVPWPGNGNQALGSKNVES